MPELPEVETIRRDLESAILGKKIIRITVKDKKVVQGNKVSWQKQLLNNKFVGTKRVGKLLALVLSNNIYLLLHLKMTGQLIYVLPNKLLAGGHPFSIKDQSQAWGGELPNKFTRLIIEFSDESCLFFNDIRRFGYAKLVTEPEWEKIKVSRFGPEPLQDNFKLREFKKSLQSRKTNIKAVLLNQTIIAGLGNIYVDESLFKSKIDPRRQANKLTDKELKNLFNNINQTIKQAIKFRGTTFSDYVDSKGKKGNFSAHLQVYGRAGKACPNCGQVVTKIRLVGRGTHICENCQK